MDAALLDRPEPPGRRVSAVLAVAVHLGLVAFLVYGITWQKRAPEAVEVELVRAVPLPAPVAEPPPEPRPEPRVEPPPPKPEPRAEPQPPRPDIAVKEKEKPKPPPKEEAKPRFDPTDALRREQQDLDRRKEQLAHQQAVDRELAQLSEAKAAQAGAARKKAEADYVARIRGKIRGNIVMPPELKGNPEAVFEVTQLPSGEVLSVKLARSSGTPAWDAATERAILKSSPLPKPDQAELFQRNLKLTFRPVED